MHDMAYAKYDHMQESAYGSILRSLTEKKVWKAQGKKNNASSMVITVAY